jgi:hypothetical protein
LTFKNHLSGTKTLFAPDPDPSLPNHKVKVSTDPLSKPSNDKPYPYDIAANSYQVSFGSVNIAPIENKTYLIRSITPPHLLPVM